MTPKQRAEYIVTRFRNSILTGRKESIEALIEVHIKEAEEKAVQQYLAEQERLREIKKTRAASLKKAREAKAKKSAKKGSA